MQHLLIEKMLYSLTLSEKIFDLLDKVHMDPISLTSKRFATKALLLNEKTSLIPVINCLTKVIDSDSFDVSIKRDTIILENEISHFTEDKRFLDLMSLVNEMDALKTLFEDTKKPIYNRMLEHAQDLSTGGYQFITYINNAQPKLIQGNVSNNRFKNCLQQIENLRKTINQEAVDNPYIADMYLNNNDKSNSLNTRLDKAKHQAGNKEYAKAIDKSKEKSR